jgi:hypothetical protein
MTRSFQSPPTPPPVAGRSAVGRATRVTRSSPLRWPWSHTISVSAASVALAKGGKNPYPHRRLRYSRSVAAAAGTGLATNTGAISGLAIFRRGLRDQGTWIADLHSGGSTVCPVCRSCQPSQGFSLARGNAGLAESDVIGIDMIVPPDARARLIRRSVRRLGPHGPEVWMIAHHRQSPAAGRNQLRDFALRLPM